MKDQIQKHIESLYVFNENYPKEILQQISDHPEISKPLIVDVLKSIIKDPQGALDKDYIVHLFALSFLGETESRDAFPVIADFLSIPNEKLPDLLIDYLEGHLDSVFYHTYNDDEKWLNEFLRNKSVSEYIRNAILIGYCGYCYHKLKDTEKLKEFLYKLIEDQDVIDEMMNFVVAVIVDFHLFDMLPAVYKLFDNHKIDVDYFDDYDSVVDSIYRYYTTSKVHHSISLVHDIEDWHCFAQNKKESKNFSKNMLDMIEKSRNKSYAVSNVKVGRNEPCPCGSGKKYKKCCIHKTQDEKALIEPDYERWLEYYPSKKEVEGQRCISQVYDAEAIAIDELLYLALHQRAIPVWEVQDPNVEKNKKKYLVLAKTLHQKKMENESLLDYDAYDKKHMIHYKTIEWINKL